MKYVAFFIKSSILCLVDSFPLIWHAMEILLQLPIEAQLFFGSGTYIMTEDMNSHRRTMDGNGLYEHMSC